jgi:predicted nuclease of predicted toxin-antitoxin system
MEIVADESVDAPIISRLRTDGHDVWSVAENAPTIHDPDVLAIANAQQRLLLTDDNDFGELVFRLGLPAPYGVARIKLPSSTPVARKAEIVSLALATYGVQLVGHLSVIEEHRVRIRP